MSPTTLALKRAQCHWAGRKHEPCYYGHSISRKPGVAMRMIRAAKRDGRPNVINWLV